MPEARTDREHRFGHVTTYAAETGDLLTFDNYGDQYSLTWSTSLDPVSFVSLWSGAGVEKERAFIQMAGPGLPVEGYLYRLLSLVKQAREAIDTAPVSLIRLWLRDAGVTWQLLPRSQDTCGAVVGVASNRVDPDALTGYFMATAAPAIVDAGQYIPELLSDLQLSHDNLDSIRAAVQFRRKYRRG